MNSSIEALVNDAFLPNELVKAKVDGDLRSHLPYYSCYFIENIGLPKHMLFGIELLVKPIEMIEFNEENYLSIGVALYSMVCIKSNVRDVHVLSPDSVKEQDMYVNANIECMVAFMALIRFQASFRESLNGRHEARWRSRVSEIRSKMNGLDPTAFASDTHLWGYLIEQWGDRLL